MMPAFAIHPILGFRRWRDATPVAAIRAIGAYTSKPEPTHSSRCDLRDSPSSGLLWHPWLARDGRVL